MEEESIRFHLIMYILHKGFPLSVLSNYINYEDIIKKNDENKSNYLYLNIAALYLSCKVEGQHLCIKDFTKSITKYLSHYISLEIKDITEENVLKYETEVVLILDYNFVFDCFFKKLYGILILKRKTEEFEVFKETLINKILREEISVISFNEFLKTI